MRTELGDVLTARSLLFVPGHRSDRFAKAENSDADVIVLDLEDAVGADAKSAARKNIDRWLGSGGSGIVRINAESSPWYDEDVAMLETLRCGVILPKIVNGDQVSSLVNRLAKGSWVMPLLETSAAILDAHKICAVPGVARAVFGNADLGSQLGIEHNDRTALLHARCSVVLASSVCELAPPVDGVTSSLTDDEALDADAAHAASLGFGGKLCLHPRQVPLVNEAFGVSADQLRWAQEVVAAAGDGSVTTCNNEIVGKPVIDRARRLLSQARHGA